MRNVTLDPLLGCMCGIAGQLLANGQRVDRGVLACMCAALEHRGPDSRGMHVDANVGLGIQRLRVIDLQTGDQPIFNEDGSIVVVLNGEIYNFRELRRDLRRAGHVFRTAGDTETIVHLYEEHGVDCVRHLHGMFAFALWDARRRRLLVARDRVGKKPLYYHAAGGRLAFASELAALLCDPSVPRDVDLGALDAYLTLGYVPAPLTAFAAVRKLAPAHFMVVEDGCVDVRRYWRLEYGRKPDFGSLDELCERIRDGLREATRKRMISDVPLGAFLSGGIDSSAVVAAMAEASAMPVKTFSIGFTHEAFDELPHARLIAERFGTDHEEFVVRPDAVSVLPRIVRHHGEPFADSSAIPSFHLAEVTRRHVTVALNGDGGDESFAGYTRYVANRLAGRLDRLPLPLRRALAAAGGRLPAGGELSSPANRARRLAGSLTLDAAERYARYVSWFDERRRAELYTADFRAATGGSTGVDAIAEAWSRASGRDVVDVMLEVDATTYLPGDLIPKIDIATMAHSLEARSPFLDHDLMELAAAIPAGLKVRGGEKKWILRRALRGWLPDEILDRPKQGFTVPIAHWLRHDLRDWSRELLLDRPARERGLVDPRAVAALLDRHDAGADGETKRIWALVMLELWHREMVDAAPIARRRAA